MGENFRYLRLFCFFGTTLHFFEKVEMSAKNEGIFEAFISLMLNEDLKNMKTKEDKKNRRIEIRLTEEEYRDINKLANEAGRTVSDLFRRRMFSTKEVKVINASDFLKSYKELVLEQKKIGNNINQLAIYANYAKKDDRFEIAVIEDMNRLMGEYKGVLVNMERLEQSILRAIS